MRTLLGTALVLVSLVVITTRRTPLPAPRPSGRLRAPDALDEAGPSPVGDGPEDR